MKIILSRKGFDSSAGGCASPLFPDGKYYSLPIPESDNARHSISYEQLQWHSHHIGRIVQDLTKDNIKSKAITHLDPDLYENSLTRHPEWLPAFGQQSAAQGHLRNQGVGKGDLFLFFGWFKAVEKKDGKYRFCDEAPDLHIIYGWLQIGDTLTIETDRLPEWIKYHPHVKNKDFYRNNVVYVAEKELKLPNLSQKHSGGGLFEDYRSILRLTAPKSDRAAPLRAHRGIWQLPCWFYPDGKPSCLSYHQNLERWQLNDEGVQLQSCSRGQEFVLNCEDYPEAQEWLQQIFCSNL